MREEDEFERVRRRMKEIEGDLAHHCGVKEISESFQ